MSVQNRVELVTLSILTLGRLGLRVEGRHLEAAVPAKATAILVYLADAGGRVRRTKLAGLLWSDHSEARARSNLRVALSRLRKELGDWIGSDRVAIWIRGAFSYDAHLVETATPEALLQLYRGDFLSDFEEAGAELFDDWVVRRRAELRARAVERLSEEAGAACGASNWTLCRQLASRLLELEPWHEQGDVWLMEARDRLAAVRDGPTPSLRLEPEDLTAAQAPVWPTKLFGRDAELDALDGLAQPRRPVSIVGPGGIGKSRLLAAFAERRRAGGRRVIYATFEGRESWAKDQIPRIFSETVLATLRVPSDGETGPEETLRRYLSNGPWTLCLDNLEQLDDVERAISDLTSRCPELEIVLTTRRHLVLVSGRILELQGLACANDGAAHSPAVELFLDRLPRSPGTDAEIQMIQRVCSMVAGHPLAIELAARWAASASIAELVAVLEANDALETTARDLPARHRALDVLVAASVDRVSRGAQRVLRAATLFAGPFSREDIEALVIVSARELSELVQHSLLTLKSELYYLHPVIRRWARTGFDAGVTPDELRSRHAGRMIEVLNRGNDEARPEAELQARAEDLLRAISWYVANTDVAELMAPLRQYLGYLRAWGWLKSGLATIDLALAREDLPPQIAAELHRYAAEAMLHAGKLEEATQALERGLALVGSTIPQGPRRQRLWNARQVASMSVAPLRLLSAPDRQRAAERARLMSLLGELYYVSEHRTEMRSYSLGSLAAGRLSREPVLIASGDAAIAVAAQLGGAHGVAERYRNRARHRLLRHADEDPFTATLTWGVTALVAAGGGRWADARNDCHASIRAARASGRARIINQVQILLALVDYHQGYPDDALRRLHDIERDIERNGFRRGLTWVHATRAEVAHSVRDFALARSATERALRTATLHDRPEDAARAHVMAARLDLESGAFDTASIHLRHALPGLAALSALAIQHLESHCGAASVAIMLERRLGSSEPRAVEMLRKLRSYAKAYPIAVPRYEGLRDTLAAHANRLELA